MVVETELLHQLYSFGPAHLSLFRLAEVCPVANQVANHILLRVVLDLLLPPPHVLERLGVRDIVHQDDRVTALVEYACYVSERFLACCVPYLQLNQLLLFIRIR